MHKLPRIWIILLLSVLVVAAGCCRVSRSRKACTWSERQVFSKARYREALIEYANVLQIDEVTRGSRWAAALTPQEGGRCNSTPRRGTSRTTATRRDST